ncbi:uncharacterized protein TNCV_265791 [Trichonephila clavipes]|nr:uncharacterized protein TNCV_265791 [Trichonephila clavipes]
MSSKRSAILELFQQGKRQCEIIRLLNIPRQIVHDAIRRFKALDNDDRRPGSDRKPTVNPSRNPKSIENLVQKNPKVSMRQIARDIGISERLVTRISKMEIGLKPYKLLNVQLLNKKKQTPTAPKISKTSETGCKSALGKIPLQ